MEIRPATISKSDCRGEKRIASAPNLDRSVRAAKTAMNSIPQQAVPKGMGQNEFFLPQFMALSNVVVKIFDLISVGFIHYSQFHYNDLFPFKRPIFPYINKTKRKNKKENNHLKKYK